MIEKRGKENVKRIEKRGKARAKVSTKAPSSIDGAEAVMEFCPINREPARVGVSRALRLLEQLVYDTDTHRLRERIV
jgi:hypothetical protein